ncbi:MAG: squalene/phytoene synthase family protein [Pseudomonadota bacterium]|nr:squalene/phytoene synthase family protein [Pseudomonadota bacterium]
MAEGDARDVAYLAGLVKELDRPRFYAALFAPERLRPDLLALFAFAAEIERIPDLVRDPTLGEIRLQFWRDRLEAVGEDVDGGAPVLRGLIAVIARHSLPVAPLMALVEARGADLYSDPPATLADAEGILGETQSSLFQLAAIVAGSAGPESAETAGHAGVAYGLARRLAGLAHEQARRRTILPLDVLARHGLGAQDVYASDAKPALLAVISDMVRQARRRLAEARAGLAALPRQLKPPFLPLAVVEPLLRRTERLGPGIFHQRAALSDLEMLTRIAWARLAWRDG